MEIRNYQEKDHQQLVEMIATVLAEYDMAVDLDGPDSDLEDIRGHYCQRGGTFFVAEADGKLIGSAGVSRVNDRTCQLRKLYLQKEYRGRGFGRTLLVRTMDFAVSNGYETMELEVSGKHRRAIHLYEQMGFVKSDIPSCCPRCDFIYTRKLQPGTIAPVCGDGREKETTL